MSFLILTFSLKEFLIGLADSFYQNLLELATYIPDDFSRLHIKITQNFKKESFGIWQLYTQRQS